MAETLPKNPSNTTVGGATVAPLLIPHLTYLISLILFSFYYFAFQSKNA